MSSFRNKVYINVSWFFVMVLVYLFMFSFASCPFAHPTYNTFKHNCLAMGLHVFTLQKHMIVDAFPDLVRYLFWRYQCSVHCGAFRCYFRCFFAIEFRIIFRLYLFKEVGPKRPPTNIPGIHTNLYLFEPVPQMMCSKVPCLTLAPFWIHVGCFCYLVG